MIKKTISILLLFGLFWNSAFGVADGFKFDFNNCEKKCELKSGCALDDACSLNIDRPCCHSVDVQFRAKEITALRIDSDCRSLLPVLLSYVLDSDFGRVCTSIEEFKNCSVVMTECLSSAVLDHYVLKTIVLQV